MDPTKTGNGATGSSACAFKSITQAVTFLKAFYGAAAIPAGTTVSVAAGTLSSATGEVFPIVVPKNVKVVGAGPVGSAASTTIVNVNAGGSPAPQVAIGFVLNADASGMQNLTLEGGGTPKASRGIWVTVGSTSGTTLDHVVVRNFAADGIVVGATPGAGNNGSGTVTIKGGTQSLNNGGTGMTVTGIAMATITGTAGGNAASGNQIAFNNNVSHGVLVYLGGHIVLTGTPVGAAAWSDGTVVMNGNGPAGLSIVQNPALTPPVNDVSGVVAYGSTSGNALRIEGGSNIKLSNSVGLGSKGNGVVVATFSHPGITVTTAQANDVSKVDLGGGTNGSTGHNVLQQPPTTGSDANADSPNNQNAGICLAIAPDIGQTLAAASNTLTNATGASVDCSVAGGPYPVSYTKNCGKDSSVGIGGQSKTDSGSDAGAANAITLTNCSYR